MSKKFCQSVKPGYYFVDNQYEKRGFYLTGTLKGNKWIELLDEDNPEWVSLIWTCIDKEMLENATYYDTNPITIPIK
jgi:hypothetical protein